MVRLQCASSTVKYTSGSERGSAKPVKVAALAFSPNGSQAAYAVHRSPVLPSEGSEDPAHTVFVAQVYTCNADNSTELNHGDAQSVVLPFSQWEVTQVLGGVHSSPVTALAWCAATGALVSASADRSACVWVPTTSTETTVDSSLKTAENAAGELRSTLVFHVVPQLVMLSTEVSLSPTSVAWCAHGNKLYVGTAGGTVAVGRYDTRQQWWICRVLLNEAHRSAHLHPHHPLGNAALAEPQVSSTQESKQAGVSCTARGCRVMSVVPHSRDNSKIAVAFLNGTVQVLSTHMKSVDGALERTAQSTTTAAATQPAELPSSSSVDVPVEAFGHIYALFTLKCWLHDIAWDPSGQQLAAVGQDSMLHVWRWAATDVAASPSPLHAACRLSSLPLLQCVFVSACTIVAAGFDGCVGVFAKTESEEWHLAAEEEARKEVVVATAVTASAETQSTTSVRQRAFDLFEKGSASTQHSAPVVRAKQVADTERLGTEAWKRAAAFHTADSPVQILSGVPSGDVAPAAAASTAPSQPRSALRQFVSVGADGRVKCLTLNTENSV